MDILHSIKGFSSEGITRFSVAVFIMKNWL